MTEQSGREPSEMVEAVAKAIAWADDEDYYEDERCYLKRARAAIEAMRMTHQLGDALGIIGAKRAWNAGINAALSDSRTDKEGA